MPKPSVESASSAPSAANSATSPANSWRDALCYPLACLGAMVGAGIGGAVVVWAARSGFYAMVVVGLLAGWGASLIPQPRGVGRWIVGGIAGVIAAAVGLWVEWRFIWVAGRPLGDFLMHLGDLPTVNLALQGISVAVAVWLGRGNGTR